MREYYSIRYQVEDPSDRGIEFAMDWRPDQKSGGYRWICLETENRIEWSTLRLIPEHGTQALLDHFGLDENDLGIPGMGRAGFFNMSPANLVLLRREKEACLGLAPKIIKNMRVGCSIKELCPEAFDSGS